MKLVSMEKKMMPEKEMSVAITESKYPYGLEIRLEEEQLQALGVKGLFGVETELMISAKVEVVSESSHDSKDGGERRCVCLQICELGLGASVKEKSSESLMYGEEE